MYIQPAIPKKTESQKASRSIETTDRKSTRLNSSHSQISYAVFCLKKTRGATVVRALAVGTPTASASRARRDERRRVRRLRLRHGAGRARGGRALPVQAGRRRGGRA